MRVPTPRHTVGSRPNWMPPRWPAYAWWGLIFSYLGGFPTFLVATEEHWFLVWAFGFWVVVGLSYFLHGLIAARTLRRDGIVAIGIIVIVLAGTFGLSRFVQGRADSSQSKNHAKGQSTKSPPPSTTALEAFGQPTTRKPEPIDTPTLAPSATVVATPRYRALNVGSDLPIFIASIPFGFVASTLENSGSFAYDNYAADVNLWFGGEKVIVDLRLSGTTVEDSQLALEDQGVRFVDQVVDALNGDNAEALDTVCSLSTAEICRELQLFAGTYRQKLQGKAPCRVSLSARWRPVITVEGDGTSMIKLFGRVLMPCVDEIGNIVACENDPVVFAFAEDRATSIQFFEGRDWKPDCE